MTNLAYAYQRAWREGFTKRIETVLTLLAWFGAGAYVTSVLGSADMGFGATALGGVASAILVILLKVATTSINGVRRI